MLTLFLPRAILCKGASRTDKGKEAYRVVVFSKPNWRNIWILSNSCRPAQCMRQPERDHFRINTLSLCTKQMQQTQIFSFVVDFFSLTNPFLCNWKSAATNRLEQDRPWWNNYEVYSLVQSFLYIFKSTQARLYNEKLTYKSVIQLLCAHSSDQR